MSTTNTLEKPKAENHNLTEKNETTFYTPATDIIEYNDHFMLLVDLPGVDQNSVDITIENKSLTIEGRIQNEIEPGFELCHAEYGVGNFQRSFLLNDEIDSEKVEATVKNGELSLKLPKKEPSLKKIEIKAS